MIEAQTLTATAREILTETDSALEISPERLNALIQPTLNEWRTRTLKNREKLKNFMVETAAVTITNGEADLTDTLDTYGIPAEEIKKAEIVTNYGYESLRRFEVDIIGVRSVSAVNGIDMSQGDVGRRVVITSSTGVVLTDTTIRNVTEPDEFVVEGDEMATTTGAIAEIFSTVSYVFNRRLAGTWDKGNTNFKITDNGSSGDVAVADIGRRAVVISAEDDHGILADSTIVSREDVHTFVVEDTLPSFSDDYVDIYDIYPIRSDALEVKFVNSRDRLTMGGRQDRFFLCAYFDGKTIYFRNPDPQVEPLRTLNGTMQIRATVVPTTLANIPAGLIGELATIMAEIVRTMNTGKQPRGVDLSMTKGG